MTDVTSILDITIHDEKKAEEVGKMSIPLLKIQNGEKKWYALKDANLRDRARGNNPRILVEMQLTWNIVSIAWSRSLYLGKARDLDMKMLIIMLTINKAVTIFILSFHG